MCDTLIAVGKATLNGTVLFAKNSDRDCNEPQYFLRIPRKKHDLTKTPKLRATYIEIDQVSETYEIVISKPSWIWGCEMGSNEFGLTIGNEAVFTREPHEPDSLIGMDYIRLALERAKTAEEALHLITNLLETYGQGGNCAFSGTMKYHNSYIIADKTCTYVLETAGRFWAYKKIDGVYSISNGLTLENDFDACHPELIDDAVRKRRCRRREDFNFKKQYSDPLYGKFSHCADRRALSLGLLQKEFGRITPEYLMKVLRAHQTDSCAAEFSAGSMKDLCMHSGFFVSNQTTASLVAEIGDIPQYFFTGSSLPCVSVFKPFTFASDFAPFTAASVTKADAYWKKREAIARMFLTNRLSAAEYFSERDRIEADIRELWATADLQTADAARLGNILRKCFTLDEEFAERIRQKGLAAPEKPLRGNWYFKKYWKNRAGKFLS